MADESFIPPRLPALSLLEHIGSERYDAKTNNLESILFSLATLNQTAKNWIEKKYPQTRVRAPLLRAEQYYDHPFSMVRSWISSPNNANAATSTTSALAPSTVPNPAATVPTASNPAATASPKAPTLGCVVFAQHDLPGAGWLDASDSEINSQELETMLCTDASVWLQPKHADQRFPLRLGNVLVLPRATLFRTDSRMPIRLPGCPIKVVVAPSRCPSTHHQKIFFQWELIFQSLFALKLKNAVILLPRVRNEPVSISMCLRALNHVLTAPAMVTSQLEEIRFLVEHTSGALAADDFALLSEGLDQLNQKFYFANHTFSRFQHPRNHDHDSKESKTLPPDHQGNATNANTNTNTNTNTNAGAKTSATKSKPKTTHCKHCPKHKTK